MELPITEAYRPLFLSLVFSGAAMLFSIILAIASGIFLSRRITRPLIELRDAAKKIGMGQLSLEIDIRGNNEISDLAGSFNTMVKDLKNTTVSRDLLLKEIQERVNAEQNLAVSEQKMSAILMASPIGIGLVYNGRLKWVNDSVLSLTGYGREFLLEHDVTILFVNEEEYKKVRGKILSGSQCSGP